MPVLFLWKAKNVLKQMLDKIKCFPLTRIPLTSHCFFNQLSNKTQSYGITKTLPPAHKCLTVGLCCLLTSQHMLTSNSFSALVMSPAEL